MSSDLTAFRPFGLCRTNSPAILAPSHQAGDDAEVATRRKSFISFDSYSKLRRKMKSVINLLIPNSSALFKNVN